MFNQNKIQRWVKEGRGQGKGIEYKPWFTAKQVSSRGRTFRPKGIKTGREHLFLSEWEYFYFLLLDWSDMANDVREQFPLLDSNLKGIQETIEIAKELNIDHPIEPSTNDLKVITTDFLFRRPDDSEVAVSFKPFKLITAREIEKMEIERIYWEPRGVAWELITDKDVPVTFAKNVDYVHSVYDLSWILKGKRKLTDITNEVDDKLGLMPGNSLTISRHLIISKKWIIDMNHPIEPNEPLKILGISASKSLEGEIRRAN